MTREMDRFGHHPDPAVDFCIEVDEIEAEVKNHAIGFVNGTPSLEQIQTRIFKAMGFRVGGYEWSVRAKNRLREIEAALSALRGSKEKV